MTGESATHSDAHTRVLLPLTRADRRIIAVLVLAPIAIYLAFAISGHVVAPGDDLNQNLPLRILSGNLLRSGHVPSWNPFNWSGTPLLAGWNAGALFPGTWLFAFVPVALAWTLNYAGAPALASVGLYLLLRRFRVGEGGAAFAGAVFAYTGFMSGQVVHIGLTQGTACTPWILLAVDVLVRLDPAEFPDRSLRALATSPRALGWVALLGAAIGCIVLAADPRAISSGVIITAIYLVAMLLRRGTRRRAALALVGAATIVGALVASIQLLPGLSVIRTSQRGSTPLSFFAAGSLPAHKIITNLLLPFALGGYHNFGLPGYNGNYNLPEITIGSGLIALVAISAFIPESIVRLARFVVGRRRRVEHDPRRQLGVWYLIVIVGGLLTLGTAWPLGHYAVHIPFFGHERLQNRNAALMDFGLAVFAGFFVDEVLRALRAGTYRHHRFTRGFGLLFAATPAVLAIAAVTTELVAPTKFQIFMQASSIRALNTRLAGYLWPTFALGVGVLGFVVISRLLRPRAARVFLGALAVLDVGLYVANASYGSSPTSLFTSTTSLSRALTSRLGGTGRFAMYDPHFAVSISHHASVAATGLPDVNALQGNPSVQGYGSIVNGVYQKVTGSHVLNNFRTRILAGESANSIDLKEFLTPSHYLESRIRPGAAIPLPAALQHLPPGVPLLTKGPFRIAPGKTKTWQLASVEHLDQATFMLTANPAASPATVTFYDAAHAVGTLALDASASERVVPIDPSLPVTTIVVTNASTVPLGITSLTVHNATTHRDEVLNGLVQGDLPYGHWVYDGHIGFFTAFRNTETHGFTWLQPPTTHTPNTRKTAPGSVSVLGDPNAAGETMTVHSPGPAILVRSMAYARGWRVTLTPAGGGPAKVEDAHRFGLIQEVTVPPGTWRATWYYRPASLRDGRDLSALGAVLLALLAIGAALRRRATRRRVAESSEAAHAIS